jgi:hypothetical protein
MVCFMDTLLPLHSMSRVEKLRAMEELWTDLSSGDAGVYEEPAWHEAVLMETREAVKAGQAVFVDWDEAKRRLRE